MREPDFFLCRNKGADQLCSIGAFVSATQIVQSLFFLIKIFEASSLFPRLCRSVSKTPNVGFLIAAHIKRCLCAIRIIHDLEKACAKHTP